MLSENSINELWCEIIISNDNPSPFALCSSSDDGRAPPVPPTPDPIYDAYVKPHQLVTLPDGRKIHLVCSGTGSPTVILTAGFSDWSAQWSKVHVPISQMSRTCSWDRAGYGFSDPSPLPQDIKHTTADLEAALQAAKIPGPYLLVGHSMGGLESLRFSDLHPNQVAGMVLVDPSIPDQARRRQVSAPIYSAFAHKGEQQYVEKKNLCASKIKSGVLTITSADPDGCFNYNASYSEELKGAMRRMDGNPARWRTRASLGAHLDNNFIEIINNKRNYGDMPLSVLTSDDPWEFGSDVDSAAKADAPGFQAELMRGNNELATLSTTGSNVIVDKTSHYIQLDKPEVVIASVTGMIDAIRFRQETDDIAKLRNVVRVSTPRSLDKYLTPIPGWNYVGKIPSACPISIDLPKRKHALDGFTVSPETAVNLASMESPLPVKCASVFEQIVYAHANSYFIFKSAFMTDAVIVDGHTGSVRIHKSP